MIFVSNQLISPTSGDLENLSKLPDGAGYVSNQLISPTSGDLARKFTMRKKKLLRFQSINIPNEWGCIELAMMPVDVISGFPIN